MFRGNLIGDVEENKEINSAAPVYTPGVSDDYIGLDGIHCGFGAIPGMYG